MAKRKSRLFWFQFQKKWPIFKNCFKFHEWTNNRRITNNYDKIIAIEASKNTYEKLCFNLNDSKIEKLNYIVHHKKDNTVFYDCVEAHTLSTTNLDWLSSPDSRFFQTGYKECILPTISIDKVTI